MSMTLAVQVWKLALDKTTTLVLMALCDSADDDGTHCHASEEYLMWKTSVSRATLYRVLNSLAERHIITRRESPDGSMETIVMLNNAPLKKPWQRPKRGGKRTQKRTERLTARPFESHDETLSVSQRDPLSLTMRPFESHSETDTQRTEPDPISTEGVNFAPIHPITHPSNPSYLNHPPLARSAETLPNTDPREEAAPPVRRTRERASPSAMERDPLFTALVDALGYRPQTRREWGQWATVLNDLRGIAATPEQVASVVRAFRATHPQAEVTPFAIVNNWASMTQKASMQHAATTVPSAEEMDASRASERAAHEQRLADWAAFEAQLVADGLSQPPAAQQSRAVR